MYGGKWNGNPDDWGQYRDVPWSAYVLKARTRHIEDLKRAQRGDKSFPFYYDWQAGEHAVRFIELLRHVDGEWAGRPFILTDWQEWDIVRPLFGWKRKDGLRRYRDAFISVARKNGKSSLVAAIGAYMLLADKEFGAQVYATATKEEQARIVWEMARKMIEFSPELRNEIKSFKRTFVCDKTGSRFMPLGRDSKTMDGFSVHCGIVDEYHAHKTSEMYDVIDDGRGARRQPLLLTITTAGFNVSSPCKKEWDIAVRLLEGHLTNDSYFAFIATVDNSQAWREPVE
jgi:phage terminase large subunit-like protein